MTSLHMVELRLDMAALLRFLTDQGLNGSSGDEDMGYGVHAWLSAAFGELAPQPWRLYLDGRRPPRILGYSCVDAKELQQRLREFADPAVLAVCADPTSAVASRIMPSWTAGRRLAFEVLCCPVGRKARTGVEKDLFLLRADGAGEQRLHRATVYCDWARERLERNQAARVNAIQLTGFRLVRQSRRIQGPSGQRPLRHPVRPQAVLHGELTVVDPIAFAAMLNHGIGRHRSFGYGMLLLKPPS